MPYSWETLQGREMQMLNPNNGLNSKFASDVGVNTPSNLLRKRNCELKNLIKICDVLDIKLDFKMLK